jgi:hypothetical protein
VVVERIIKKGIGKGRERKWEKKKKEWEKGRKRIGGELEASLELILRKLDQDYKKMSLLTL